MQLSLYLAAEKITAAEFGRRVGLSRQRLHTYVRGSRFPSPTALRRIRDATGGAVTADDFVDQHAPPAEAA